MIARSECSNFGVQHEPEKKNKTARQPKLHRLLSWIGKSRGRCKVCQWIARGQGYKLCHLGCCSLVCFIWSLFLVPFVSRHENNRKCKAVYARMCLPNYECVHSNLFYRKPFVVTVYVEFVLRLSHFVLDIYWIKWNLTSVSAAGRYRACTATPAGMNAGAFTESLINCMLVMYVAVAS